MANLMVTGGSGFLGSLLIQRLLEQGHEVENIDLVVCPFTHPRLRSIVGDIRDRVLLDREFNKRRFDAVFHCAALLAHSSISSKELWSSNVDGTSTLAEAVKAAHIPVVIYTSSNCLWGIDLGRPVREEDQPCPIERYGESKWEGEKVLLRYTSDFATVIIRCPTIIDEGRLGLLSILFEFIHEGRRVWVVGDGANRYQFIYAQDLIDAMLLAWKSGRTAVFGIGSDNVLSIREIYGYVIAQTNSRSRIAHLPKRPAVGVMKAAHHLHMSPLGPYHYRMIAANFCFDTNRIKAELNWRPTLTNHEMLLRSYLYYAKHLDEIRSRGPASSHRKPAAMGIIRLLKWLS